MSDNNKTQIPDDMRVLALTLGALGVANAFTATAAPAGRAAVALARSADALMRTPLIAVRPSALSPRRGT